MRRGKRTSAGLYHQPGRYSGRTPGWQIVVGELVVIGEHDMVTAEIKGFSPCVATKPSGVGRPASSERQYPANAGRS